MCCALPWPLFHSRLLAQGVTCTRDLQLRHKPVPQVPVDIHHQLRSVDSTFLLVVTLHLCHHASASHLSFAAALILLLLALHPDSTQPPAWTPFIPLSTSIHLTRLDAESISLCHRIQPNQHSTQQPTAISLARPRTWLGRSSSIAACPTLVRPALLLPTCAHVVGPLNDPSFQPPFP